MYSKRTKLAKMSLLMIIMILFAVVFSGVMVLAEEQPEEALEEEQKEYEETIDWKSNTKNGEIDLSEGIDFGNSDWESETFVEEGAADVESSELPEGNNTAATAVLAAVAGVLGATALTGKELLEKNKTSIIPKGNGIWVPEEDREKVEEMINKVANKEYFIDEEGFLNSVDDDEIDPSKSETYSRVLDKLIAGDRKVVVSIDNGWSFYNPDTDKTEKIDFEAQDGGISIGDNGTDHAVVISGEAAELEDVDGNKIYGGSELLLAHELIHSLRGVYGLRNKDEDGGVNEDEEAHTIQLENKIRYELGYGLRGDGDSSDDINQDGIADGDGTYGEYSDEEGTEDWFEDIDEKKGLMGLVGSIYNHYSKSYYYRKYKKYKEKYKSYYSKYRKYKKKYKKKKRSKYKRKYKEYYKKYKKYKERYKKYYKKYKVKSKDLKKDKSKKKNNSNSNSSKPKNSGNSTIPAWLDWDRDGKIDTKEDKKNFDKDNNGVADWVDEERKSNKSKSKEDKMTVVTNKTLISSVSKGGSSKNNKNTLDEILSFDPTYKYNENTEKLQKRLNELGFKGADGKPLVIDGKFGKNTLNAVNDFKEKNKLWNFGKYEGKVGNTTWDFLFPKKTENKSQENKSNSKIMDFKEQQMEEKDRIAGGTSNGEDTSVAEGNLQNNEYIYADSIRKKLIDDGFRGPKEYSIYDWKEKVIDGASSVIQDFLVGLSFEVAKAYALKVVAFETGYGYIATASTVATVMEKYEKSNIIKSFGGDKLEIYSYNKVVQSGDGNLGIQTTIINKKAFIISKNVDGKQAVVGIIAPASVTVSKTGTITTTGVESKIFDFSQDILRR